ncbi:hypothetical protein [Marinomonas sp.]|uniref:hypothetical protein n=1 Tax=Marinomonas sp. TaxID=1904862 RepID=UPI003A8D332C
MYGGEPNRWLNKHGDVVLQAQEPCEHQTAVVIDEETLNYYVGKFDIEPIWIMITERNTWPNGDNDESCWRRSEGVVWREGGLAKSRVEQRYKTLVPPDDQGTN